MTVPISETAARSAIAWMIELQAGSDERQRRNWQAWREADPEHERAWQRIEQVNQRMRLLSPQAARTAVEALPNPARRRALKVIGGLALTVPAAWLGHNQARPLFADYRSAVGEQRHINLADGSQLQLNTDSAVNVWLGNARRELELINGEISLQVAHQQSRTLLLSTAQGLLLTEQASLALRQDEGSCSLKVIAGSVMVSCHGSGMRRMVGAGQAVRFTETRIDTPQPLSADQLAWRHGMLVARDMRLGDFILELSRYRRGWLNCAPEVAELRVSGTFPLQDQQAIFAMLKVVLPVQVRRRTDYWLRVEKKSTPA